MQDLNYVGGKPKLAAILKQECADFRVDEELGFTLAGQGEHLWLKLRKTDLTTTDAARRLSESCGVPLRTVGYSGMKDRRGECTQWFSLPLQANGEARLAAAEDSSIQILETQRNSRKLKIGSHKANHFRIRLRSCTGSRIEFEHRLTSVNALGVPNYFGSQRFGQNMSNMSQVEVLMKQALDSGSSMPLRGQVGKVKRGMLFSAARAYVFNQLLSQRISHDTWNRYVAGDVLNLDGTARFFALGASEQWDQELQHRLEKFDIHITGPLAGKKESKDKYASTGKSADMEEVVLKKFDLLVAGLMHFKVNASRRSLRFQPRELCWHWDESAADLVLEFTLPRGAYATSLLREVCVTE